MANEPTILVKQDDGTSVRMTLSEFTSWREKRTGNTASSVAAPPVAAPKQNGALPIIDALPENKVTPIENTPKVSDVKKNDTQTSVQEKNDPNEEEPIAGMFLPKDDDMATNMQKNEKTDPPTKRIDPKPTQSNSNVFSASKSESSKKKVPELDHQDKKPTLAEQLYRMSKTKPSEQSPTPSTTPKLHAAQTSSSFPKPLARMGTQKPGVDMVTNPPPRKAIMGPVDEFAVLSLTDFRRMGGQPADAAAKIKEKFTTLQDESYLMYLEGIEAWKGSPLYKQYQGVLVNALESGQSLSDYISGQNELSLADMEAIAELNSSLL